MSLSGLLRKADSYLEHGEVLKAYNTYKEAIEIAKKKKMVSEDVLVAYNNLVILQLRMVESRQDLLKAKSYALEFVRTAKRTKNHSDLYAIARFHAGVIMLALGDVKGAIKQLEEAFIVFEIIGYDEGLMLTCKNLYEAYRHLGYWEKANIYKNRAEALARKLGSMKSLVEVENMVKSWRNTPWKLSKA